jgi:hypothetical protein
MPGGSVCKDHTFNNETAHFTITAQYIFPYYQRSSLGPAFKKTLSGITQLVRRSAYGVGDLGSILGQEQRCLSSLYCPD